MVVGKPAGGWEAEVLRERVGIVVVADVAGFLPWATEDIINTRPALDCRVRRVVLGSIRVVRHTECSKGTRRGWRKKGKGLVVLDEVWLGTTGVIVLGVGNISHPSQTSENTWAYASASYENRG